MAAACQSVDKYTAGEIIFVLETYLSIPKIEVRPSVDEVQKMLNTIGQTILSVCKGVGQWKSIEGKKKKSDAEVVGTL